MLLLNLFLLPLHRILNKIKVIKDNHFSNVVLKYGFYLLISNLAILKIKSVQLRLPARRGIVI